MEKDGNSENVDTERDRLDPDGTLVTPVATKRNTRIVIDTHEAMESLGVSNGGTPTKEEPDAKVTAQPAAIMKAYGAGEDIGHDPKR